MADGDDIHETADYGYDPSFVEDIPVAPVPKAPTALPPSATVTQDYLPPVGKQTTPSCFVWSSTYGATTFASAATNGTNASSAAGQASPIYTYIKVEEQQGIADNTCQGGTITSVFSWLNSNGGTASMQDAGNLVGCTAAWTAWDTATLPPNWQFQVLQTQAFPLKNGQTSLTALQTLIAQDIPVVWGTSLYTDFPTYAGSPVPYGGNGTILINKKTGKPAGHCMVVIGYDTTCGPNGAVLIQNSFGQTWGSVWPSGTGTGGYMWMDCNTFQTLAQGPGFYITQIQTQAPK